MSKTKPHTCAKPFDLNDAVSPFRSKRPQKGHVILTSKTKRKINRCCKIRKSYFSNNDVSFFKSREKLSKLFGAYFLGIYLVELFIYLIFFLIFCTDVFVLSFHLVLGVDILPPISSRNQSSSVIFPKDSGAANTINLPASLIWKAQQSGTPTLLLENKSATNPKYFSCINKLYLLSF